MLASCVRYAIVLGLVVTSFFAPHPTRAQFTFRVDVARVRSTPLEDSARDLFSSVGEWRLVFEGSDIDAVSDLDRFSFEAPPGDMSRALVVVRHRHDVAWVRARAEALAQVRGETLEWRTENGVPVTDWYALDHRRRPRVLVILGRTHFAVGRPADVFARLAHAGVHGPRPRPAALTAASDQTLAMGTNAIVAIDLGGLQAYFARSRRVAQGISVALASDGSRFSVDGIALFDDEAAASWRAAEYTALANSPAPRVGHPGVVRLLRYEAINRTVRILGTLDVSQVRDEIEYQARINARRGIVQRL